MKNKTKSQLDLVRLDLEADIANRQSFGIDTDQVKDTKSIDRLDASAVITKTETDCTLTATMLEAPAKRTSARRRRNLPKDFHQNLVEAQNRFNKMSRFQNVEEIIELYKIGVEFYSGRDEYKSKAYFDMLQNFIANKKVLKIIEKNKLKQKFRELRSRSSKDLSFIVY